MSQNSKFFFANRLLNRIRMNQENNQYLIVGLGNPGRQYKYNRHNVGFLTLDRLASRFNESFSRVESKSLVLKINHEGNRYILAKPQTYMNLSGGAVSSLVHFYKIKLENLLIVYDDVDLPQEVIRLRPGGGSGGHKGMQSIIKQLGTHDFPRMRIGVGRPPGRKGAADYVLENFSPDEVEFLPNILDRAVEAIFVYTVSGLIKAMNQYNRVDDVKDL
jgi:PTH1 family peptidyl-tRNA hydrolase